MKGSSKIIFAILFISLTAGCSQNKEETSRFTAFAAEDMTIAAEATDAATVSLSASGPWSTRVDVDWLTASPQSGDKGDWNVRIISSPNTITKSRTGRVQFICGEDKRMLTFTQDAFVPAPEPEPEPVSGPLLTDGFSKSLHFSTGRLRTTTAVMQSFDISKDGETIFYSQLNNKFRVYVSWNGRNSEETPTSRCMTLCYSGHGSNFTLEETAHSDYIWISNYASQNASGDYWDAQIISRIPVQAGATFKPWQSPENYYFGEKNIAVSVDIDGDMLTILGVTTGRIRTYRLSQLKALPEEDITLEPLTYGGESKSDDPKTTVSPVVKARDGRKVTPLGDFTITREHYSDGTTVSWQGFDIHDGLIYQSQGNGHADGTPSPGWLQVRKIDGTVVIPLTKFKALEDLDALKTAGITDTGYMEPEGVKFRHGAVFCGFCSKRSDDVRRGTIFRYDPKLVQ